MRSKSTVWALMALMIMAFSAWAQTNEVAAVEGGGVTRQELTLYGVISAALAGVVALLNTTTRGKAILQAIKAFRGKAPLLGLMLAWLVFGGCASIKERINLGDGKILGVVAYELPAGVVLPDGQVIEPGANLTDVLIQLGINVAASELKEKWDVQAVIVGVDPQTGQEVTQVVTKYGTFSFATGELRKTIKAVSFREEAATGALQIQFEDADGSVVTGTIPQ